MRFLFYKNGDIKSGKAAKGDFHIHTFASDGKKNYVEILYEANKLGLEYIAFTDHNCDYFDNWEKYISTDKVTVIPGCELSVEYKGRPFHLLVYNYKPMFKKIILPKIQKLRNEHKRINIKKVCKLVHLFGGIAVLAHPFKYGCDGRKLVNDIVKENCLDGIECIHPYHSADEIEYLLKFCEEHDLIVTYGSDYHDDNKLINRGEKGNGYQKGLGDIPLVNSSLTEYIELLNENNRSISKR